MHESVLLERSVSSKMVEVVVRRAARRWKTRSGNPDVWILRSLWSRTASRRPPKVFPQDNATSFLLPIVRPKQANEGCYERRQGGIAEFHGRNSRKDAVTGCRRVVAFSEIWCLCPGLTLPTKFHELHGRGNAKCALVKDPASRKQVAVVSVVVLSNWNRSFASETRTRE